MSFLSQHRGEVFGYGTRRASPQLPVSLPLPKNSCSPLEHLLLPAAPISASPSPASSPPAPSKLAMCFAVICSAEHPSQCESSIGLQQPAAGCACSPARSSQCWQPQLVLLRSSQHLGPALQLPAAASSPAPTQPTSTEPTGAHGSNARDKKTLRLPAVTFTAGLPHTAPHGPPPQAHCSVIPTHSDPPGQTKTLPWCSGHSGAFLQFLLILLLSEVHFEPWLPG